MNRKITLLVLIAGMTNAFSQNLNFTNKADKLIARSASASSKDDSNDNIYVVNGFSPTSQYTSEIEKYNLFLDSWALFPTSIPTIPKRYGNMEIFQSTMYIFNGIANTGLNNDKVEMINLNDGNVTVSTALNPNPVSGGGSSIWGDRLVTFGGCISKFNATYSNKLNFVNPWSAWTPLADMPVGLETKGEVIYGDGTNSKLYVFGGYKETNATAENFQTVTVGANIALTDWVNVAEAGTKLFVGQTFGSNKYAQMSAFDAVVANQQASNISWLISNPLTASNQALLNFDTKDGYNNGAVLQAYLITNWTGNIATSTKTLLGANIASGSTVGYATNFRNSGDIVLPGDLTEFRIGFKYVGGYSPLATTTYQIDNVRVFNSNISNNIYVYDFTSNSWSTSATVLPQSLSAYSIAKDDITNTKIYITGDYANQTFAGVFDTTNNSFTSLTQANMIGRRHHNSEFWNNKLYIFGGNTDSSSASSLASTQSTDLPNLSSEAFAANAEFKVFPNPVSEILNLNNEIETVSIYSVDGKKMEVQKVNNTVNVSKLNSGIYLLVGENRDGKTFTTKVVKQ